MCLKAYRILDYKRERIQMGIIYFLISMMSSNNFLLKHFREISVAVYNFQVLKNDCPPQNPFAAYRPRIRIINLWLHYARIERIRRFVFFKNLFTRIVINECR